MGPTRRGPSPGSPAGDPNRRVPSSSRAVRPQIRTLTDSPQGCHSLTPRRLTPVSKLGPLVRKQAGSSVGTSHVLLLDAPGVSDR